MAPRGQAQRRWRAAVGIIVLGALVGTGCGGDDDEAGGASTSSPPTAATGADDAGEAGADPSATEGSGEASASATIGTTVYAFVPGDRAFCRMDERAGALSVSGLIDEATGAELSVGYSADSKATANASVSVDGGPDLESSAAVSPAPPAFRIDGGRATGGGQFIDVSDPGSELLDGQIVVNCG